MTLRRTTVRTTVVAGLDGETAAGSNVIDSPFRPEGTFPAVRVRTLTEEFVEYEETQGGDYVVMVPLEIIAIAQGTEATLAGVLDSLAEECQTWVESDITLGGAARTALYRGTAVEYDGDVDPPLGEAIIRYEVFVDP